jgi:hypothetical protein
LIITRDPARMKESEAPVWGREQEAFKALSPLSWRVIARGSRHAVHHDRPDLVIAEMTRLVGYVRGGPAPSFGSTAFE